MDSVGWANVKHVYPRSRRRQDSFFGGRVIRLLCGYTAVGLSRCVRWIALLEFVSDAFLVAAVLTLCCDLVGGFDFPYQWFDVALVRVLVARFWLSASLTCMVGARAFDVGLRGCVAVDR